ncbi:hypothetical protein EXS61_02045 [Candidatus Parcubacteria bacterium]|nr:hypothetical protein [Candidatus Parcubacteria bacterium]
MTNLLPQTKLASLAKEYKYRLTTVVIFTFVVVVVLSAGFLVPSFIISNVKLAGIAVEAQKVRAVSELQNTKSTSGTILKDIKMELALLRPDASEDSVQNVIGLITKNKSSDIRIQSVSYVRSVAGTEDGKIVVSGIAKNRKSLTTLTSQIQSNSIFKNVDLPISNFAKYKDIAFSMQISGSF